VNFLQHPTNNQVLGAPPSWDHSQQGYCNALPVTKVLEGDRVSMVSFWRPSAAELKAINAGAPIMLWIHSASHPPVSIGVEGVAA
jgi:hypothetical protein